MKRRRDRLIRHTLKHQELAGTILEGTVEGCKRKERQKLEYVKQIIDDVGCSGYCKMKDSLRIRTDGELHQTSLRTADFNNNNISKMRGSAVKRDVSKRANMFISCIRGSSRLGPRNRDAYFVRVA